MDPDSTPDSVPEREDATTNPAPAPRSSRSRTPARPPARAVADDAQTREFPEEFRLGTPRPGLTDPVPTDATPTHVSDEPRPSAEPYPRTSVAELPPADRSTEATVPTNIYRARRPAAAAMLVIPAVLFGLLLARGLAMSAFGKEFVLSGVIASSLALAALPLLVAGLYGLITGAAYGAEQWGFRVWARPPLAYLLVGISLLLAAGLALR